ncbi:MAG: bifunctional diaminohydroxyphosphoribosylaminopyrimidine deaminase/5-amino-6-(5-phosphoribosylamino)uracil reductase RibD [Candidatus Aegiribacteria sp.]|nr:bifunctional diaminohydroxyphosphoribosylaminopyrimidine deaminase/5-amino-6-(5-phosphoribosylamino)uracil reductase RibD [Candidatus Aegiribacteria sp.]
MASLPEIQAMKRALELAFLGRRAVFPNPMVGAVVLDSSGNSVGEGFHEKCGAPHAEINALSEAGAAASSGTIVVSLEPCCHYGRTGPCTDAIIKAGIRKVVIAMRDPHPNVSGKGIEQLESARIEVETCVLLDEAELLNRVYLHYLRTSRSWVTLKMALSMDGRTAAKDGSSRWLSCEESRKQVHRMRASAQAVMTGAGTVRDDNPELTARFTDHPLEEQPVRIVVSATGDLGNSRKIFEKTGRVIIAVPESVSGKLQEFQREFGADIWEFPADSTGYGFNLIFLLERTASEGFGEILCECGRGLATMLMRKKLVNTLSVFITPLILGGEGLPAFEKLGIDSMVDSIRLENVRSSLSGTDTHLEGEVVYGTD